MSVSSFLTRIPPRRIFLIDGVGALVSALMLGIVLIQIQSLIGMPSDTLRYLALTAGGFAVYSCVCYIRFPRNWPIFLRVIAVVNLLYCCATAALVVVHVEMLTAWGIAYFVGEILLVVGLALLELKIANDQ